MKMLQASAITVLSLDSISFCGVVVCQSYEIKGVK